MRRLLLLPALLALLCVGQTFAQSSPATLKPRNTLTFPTDAPLDVEVRFDDAALGYEAYRPASSGISPVGDILATARFRKMEDETIRPAVAALNAGLSKASRSDALAEAVRHALEATGKIRVGALRVYDSMHPAPDATVDPDRPILLLRCAYGMEPMMSGFSVRLFARHGRRADLVSADFKSPSTFLQTFTSRDPAPKGSFLGFAEDQAAYWANLGPQALDAKIDAGLRDVAGMLAYELLRKPRFGRIPGKQYPVDMTYAAKETEHGDRAWLRLRDGRLVSVPLSSLD